jgi:hypothetical protein
MEDSLIPFTVRVPAVLSSTVTLLLPTAATVTSWKPSLLESTTTVAPVTLVRSRVAVLRESQSTLIVSMFLAVN